MNQAGSLGQNIPFIDESDRMMNQAGSSGQNIPFIARMLMFYKWF